MTSSTPRAMNAFLERIMAGFNEPVRCRNGATHAVGVSVGVAHFIAGDDSDSSHSPGGRSHVRGQAFDRSRIGVSHGATREHPEPRK